MWPVGVRLPVLSARKRPCELGARAQTVYARGEAGAQGGKRLQLLSRRRGRRFVLGCGAITRGPPIAFERVVERLQVSKYDLSK